MFDNNQYDGLSCSHPAKVPPIAIMRWRS